MDINAWQTGTHQKQAPSYEIFLICFPEFGLENVVKHAIIVRALYCGKSTEANYWQHSCVDEEEIELA